MVLDLPNEPRRGNEITAAWGTRVVRCLRALQWQSSPSLDVTTIPSGTTGKVRRTGGGSAPAADPFTLLDASTAGSLKIGIVPGTVNGVSPTFTGALPAGVLSADPPPLLTITESTWFWLKCVGTFGTPDSYVVSVETTPGGDAPPAGTEITGDGFVSFIKMGVAVVVSGAITTIESELDSNMRVESYGTINFWWEV